MRKALLLLLCLLLCLPLLSPAPARAADSYLITIAENTLLTDTSNNGMAVYIDGIIYIPYHTLAHTGNVQARYDAQGQFVTVWRPGAMMHFELDTGATYDVLNNRTVNISAKMRGDVPYLPAALVATWMEMYISVIPAAEAAVDYPVLRMCSDATPAISDQVLLRRLAVDLNTVSTQRARLDGPAAQQPEELPPRDIALLFTALPQNQVQEETRETQATDPLPGFLDQLEQYDLPAAFCLPEETLRTRGESLRELYVRGHSPGILLTDGADPLDEARRCSELYRQQLHTRVRLVCAPGLVLTDAQKSALSSAGFVLWTIDHDPVTADLTARKAMTALRKVLRDAPEQSVLTLPATALTGELLPLLHSYLNAQNFTTIPIREWTIPFPREVE